MIVKIFSWIIVIFFSLMIFIQALKLKNKKVLIVFSILTVFFYLLFSFTSISKKKVDKVLDTKITKIEKEINTQNPELFTKKLETQELMAVLNNLSNLKVATQNETFNIIANLASKSFLRRINLYASGTKGILNYVGAGDGTISIQEVIQNTKNDVLNIVIASLYILKTLVFVAYSIVALIVLSSLKEKALNKQFGSKNGVTFGDNI